MAAGELRKDPKGYYVVDQSGGVMEPKVKMISPIEQAVNLAKSELKKKTKSHKGNTKSAVIHKGKKVNTKSPAVIHKGKSTKKSNKDTKKSNKGRTTAGKKNQSAKDIFE